MDNKKSAKGVQKKGLYKRYLQLRTSESEKKTKLKNKLNSVMQLQKTQYYIRKV